MLQKKKSFISSNKENGIRRQWIEKQSLQERPLSRSDHKTQPEARGRE